MYFNESKILRGRLKYLYDKVDYFVISEANITHSGKPKPLNFLKEMPYIKEYLDKVLYFPLAIDPAKYDLTSPVKEYDYEAPQWVIEKMQRSHLMSALSLFDDNDIVMVSDADEIPSRVVIDYIINTLTDETPAYGLFQDMFYYNFNQRQTWPWVGTIAARNKFVKQMGVQWMRDNRGNVKLLPGAGWHLSYWGQAENVLEKIQGFAHQELNTPENANLQNLAERIANGQDPFARSIPFEQVDINSLPYDLVEIFK